ncbi:RNA polymerase sigma factor [Pullulanibacillus sp. KACC 23026]|uniref:RNA polymerase sigma factor n=1 Tax=Pullulanibacillus sp. KACC 23026 TaxID=3028315 RepID=UPI0023B1A826|nr:RNA polymerase sigma factor [Pullulanibacillus sp. KACC 23026]WEG12441.1 RNA polymerase sigma factor [Pullulanibacillus sp. KACC 23026]
MEASGIYDHLKSDLFRFARSIARHEQEVQDLVQDALIKSLSEETLVYLPDYKQRAWFYRVMKNRLIDDRRKERRLVTWDHELEFPAQDLVGSEVEMVELLSHLSADLSDIVFKRYWIGLSSQEIGEQLQLPASTVRYKLHLAVKKLRKMLRED